MHQTKHLLAINTGCSHIKLNVIPTQKDTNQSCCFSKIGKKILLQILFLFQMMSYAFPKCHLTAAFNHRAMI